MARRLGIVLTKGNVNLLAAGFSDVEPVEYITSISDE
jgi:hypothetical protein